MKKKIIKGMVYITLSLLISYLFSILTGREFKWWITLGIGVGFFVTYCKLKH